MSSNVPLSLKSIRKFIREADTIGKIEPNISHFCRLYAIQQVMNTDGSKSAEIKKWLNIQLSLCEVNSHLETENAWTDAKIKIIKMANNIFKNADQIYRTGQANTKTAVAFNSAHVLYEVLKLRIGGGSASDSDKTNERSKYCLSKATDILKSIKQKQTVKHNINSYETTQNEKQARILFRYNLDVISQLVDLKMGTRNECIAASKICVDFNNINEVLDQLTRLKQQKQHISTVKPLDDDDRLLQKLITNNANESDGSISGYSNLSSDGGGASTFYHVIFNIDVAEQYLCPYENDKVKEELLFSGFIRSFKCLDLLGNDATQMISNYCKGVVNIICDSAAINIVSESDKSKASDLLIEAVIQERGCNDVNQAIELYTRAMCYNPNDYCLFLMRSKCYLKLKKYETALQDIQTALEIEPGCADSWYYYGLINLHLNNIEEAGVGFGISMQMVSFDTDKQIFKFIKNDKQNLKILIHDGLTALSDKVIQQFESPKDEYMMEGIDDIITGERFFNVTKIREDLLIDLAENELKSLYEKFENKMSELDEQGIEINHMIEVNEYVGLFELFLKHDKYKEYAKQLKFYKLVQEAFYNSIGHLEKRQFEKGCQRDCVWCVTCTSLSKIKYNKRLFGILIMGTAHDDLKYTDLIAKYTVYGEPTADQLIQILKRTISCNISNGIRDEGQFRFFVPKGIIFGDNIPTVKQQKIINYFDSRYDDYPIEIIASIRNYFEEHFWRKFEKQRQIQFPNWRFVGWNNLNMFKWSLIH